MTKTEEFIKKSKEVHGDLYDYSKVEYINARTKVNIICNIHGDFYQRMSSHLDGNGCKKCATIKRQKLNKNKFIKISKKIHKNKFDYKLIKETHSVSDYVEIICPEHGVWKQQVRSHITGKDCRKCIDSKKSLTTEEFIKKAKEVHGNRYDYSKVVYINSYTKIIIGCSIHGVFKQTPHNHLIGTNCPKCSKSNYSQKAIIWLDQIAAEQNISIQHAENKGEYKIPGTRYRADGFCKQNNTIYEFYGDIWHGNLNLFEENEQCHPFKNESAGSLYMKTKQREEEIKDIGYNLVSIWENDFLIN